MGYTVSVNHPHFPEGTSFGVGNLGVIPNGGSKEIDEDSERLFVMARGLPLDKAFDGDPIVTVKGKSVLDKKEVDGIVASFAAEPETEYVVEQPDVEEEENVAATTLNPPRGGES